MKFTIVRSELSPLYFVILALTAIFSQSACADSVLITGAIFNRAGTPLPGCTVFVVSGNYRTLPSITKTSGTFEIELSVEGNSPSYFLEIYWGKVLMYRKPFNGPLSGAQNGVFQIPPITLGL